MRDLSDKYALALCDALFSDDELAGSCTKRNTKPPLDAKNVELLEGTMIRKQNYNILTILYSLYSYFWQNASTRNLGKAQLNQKFLDIFNKQVKKENGS